MSEEIERHVGWLTDPAYEPSLFDRGGAAEVIKQLRDEAQKWKDRCASNERETFKEWEHLREQIDALQKKVTRLEADNKAAWVTNRAIDAERMKLRDAAASPAPVAIGDPTPEGPVAVVGKNSDGFPWRHISYTDEGWIARIPIGTELYLHRLGFRPGDLVRIIKPIYRSLGSARNHRVGDDVRVEEVLLRTDAGVIEASSVELVRGGA